MAAHLQSLGMLGGPLYLVGVLNEACQYPNASNGPELAQERLWVGEKGLFREPTTPEWGPMNDGNQYGR
jgi:hypothetical protein